MEVNCQLHASAALPQGKSPLYPLGSRLDGPPQPVWTLWRIQNKSLVPAGNRIRTVQPVDRRYTEWAILKQESRHFQNIEVSKCSNIYRETGRNYSVNTIWWLCMMSITTDVHYFVVVRCTSEILPVSILVTFNFLCQFLPHRKRIASPLQRPPSSCCARKWSLFILRIIWNT
jgi:hypothetical protein